MVAPFGLKTKGTVSARVLPIAEALAARGHKVRIIIPPWDDPAGSADLALKKPRLESHNGVELLYVPVKTKPQALTIPVRMVWEVLKYRPEIVHVFKPKAYSGLAALLLSLLRRPFVLDTDDWEGSGGYNDVSPYSRPQKWLFAWQERDLPRRAAGESVASRTLQTQAWGFGVAPERVLYLPNGIAPARYASWYRPEVAYAARLKRQELGVPEDGLVLLAYTRFVEFKPERLLELAEDSLAKMSPELAAKTRLLVVGGGFYGEEKGFRELAAQYSLDDRLILTGTVPPEELPALLACGDIALYPFDDNLINRARCSAKFLDLLMAGLPVVTEAVGELREYLQDSQGGYLVPLGDREAFSAAVARLTGLSAEERAALGAKGALRLQEKYRWELLVEGLEDFYLRLKERD
ncbi:MAG TPA: glycosyltransferase family 4 protein [Chloroflexia bacterium]|nr:glycosyltransferase family 4 protein [Chloroflexia bacterium]